MATVGTTKPWRVLKISPRCVSTARAWHNVAKAVQEMRATHRVWLVVSAPYGVLEGLSVACGWAAEAGSAVRPEPVLSRRVRVPSTVEEGSWVNALQEVQRLCLNMAADLELTRDDLVSSGVLESLTALRRLLEGVFMVGHASPRVSARVLAHGPLIATQIAHAFFRRALRGGASPVDPRTLAVVDTRELLTSGPRDGTAKKQPIAAIVDEYLNAYVPVRCDPRKAVAAAGAGAEVVLGPARIARNTAGETVVLGYGGNGGSAALVAALLAADNLLLVTSVRGLYTCDPHYESSLPATPHRARSESEANRVRPFLLKALSYHEAIEFSALGLPPLPMAALMPAAYARTTVEVVHGLDDILHTTMRTCITETGGESDVLVARSTAGTAGGNVADAGDVTVAMAVEPRITGVAVRSNIIAITMATFDMWGAAGFLTTVFSTISKAGASVDLVTTSQTTVTVTLDSVPGGVDGSVLASLVDELRRSCTVKVRYPCCVVSVVGRNLRSGLNVMRQVLESLDGIPVHMMTESAADVGLSIVSNQAAAAKLVARLHTQLFRTRDLTDNATFGPSVDTYLPESATPSPWEWPWRTAAEQAIFDADPTARFEFDVTKGVGGPAPLPSLQDTHGGEATRSGAGAGAGAGATSGAVDAPPLPVQAAFDDPVDAELATEAVASAAADALNTPESVWWKQLHKRDALLRYMATNPIGAVYAYDLDFVQRQARGLMTHVPCVHAFYYAMKANSTPDILRILAGEGFGMECVSLAELRHARSTVPDAPLLFTPNFCGLHEYKAAFELGAEVTIDGDDILLQAPQVFAGKDIALRIDPGRGLGHSKKVVTAGASQKFGHPIEDVEAVAVAAKAAGATIVGIHTHVGSGVMDATAWTKTAQTLVALLDKRGSDGTVLFPHVKWVDVGGGLGVPQHSSQAPLDLHQLHKSMEVFSRALQSRPRPVELHMEPGRYMVSEAGVLLLHVTQVRTKGGYRFVGVDSGMNALIRPALYKAVHEIVNYSRLGEADEPTPYQVVGPICETGDVLGHDRLLPKTVPGDVLLVGNGGAYGAVMSSYYNRRLPASEVVITTAPTGDVLVKAAPNSNFPVW